MKINKQLYDQITSEPFDVQEIREGVKVELHSLNDSEDLYNAYASQAKFAVWSSKDGSNYKLLVEDGYYQRMRELYTKRVNKIWLGFWDEVEAGRKKVMFRIFIPTVVVALLAAIILLIFSKKLQATSSGDTITWILVATVLVGFIAVNVITNKKIDKIIEQANSKAVEDIKNIVGHDRFDFLMQDQQTYYDEFFHIEHEEENQEEVVEEQEEVQEEENKEE